jgi:hypothetical protein
VAQDRQSGAQANLYGHDCAGRIAAALGARKLYGNSNECAYQDQVVSIHCAKPKTTKVGATYKTLKNVSAVWGAFASDGGPYDIWSLSVKDYQANMKPTRSTGASSGKVGTVERSVFERLGSLIAQFRI